MNRYKRIAALASGSVGAMAVQALSSFVLQIVAAGTIGASSYGKFTIIIGLLSTLTALRAGIDDAPLVLEHHDASLRRPVLASQYASVAAVFAIALTIGVSTNLTDSGEAFVLALMAALWSLEEMGRRFFMRDQRFTALVINDVIYAVGALGAIGAQYALGPELGLVSFLWAIAAGSALSFAAAVVQLPAGTFDPRQVSLHGIGAVLRFATWRSGQVVIRPLSITLTRVGLAALTSTAVLGNLETARLILQPVWVAISGLGPFLLTHYVRREATVESQASDRISAVSALLMAMGATWGLLAVFATDTFQSVFGGGDIDVDRTAVAAWAVFYVVSAGGLPIMSLLVARRDTFGAFVARVLDGGIGLALAIFFAWSSGPSWAPLGLAVGALVGAAMMWQRSLASRRLVAAAAR